MASSSPGHWHTLCTTATAAVTSGGNTSSGGDDQVCLITAQSHLGSIQPRAALFGLEVQNLSPFSTNYTFRLQPHYQRCWAAASRPDLCHGAAAQLLRSARWRLAAAA
jgi:hypothetical protein